MANLTIEASSLEWMTTGNGLWAARIDDLSGSTVTFSAGYTPTVSGKLVKVSNSTKPTGTLTYTTDGNAVQPSAPLYKAGSVRDSENVAAGSRTRNVGSVDLSTLEWTEASGVYTATLSDMKSNTDNIAAPNGYAVTVDGTSISITASASPTGTMYYELEEAVATTPASQTMSLQAGNNVIAQEDGAITNTDATLSYNGTDYAIATASSSKYLKRVNGADSVVTGVTSVAVKGGRDMLVNLTRWFGKGREPASADAFYKLYPKIKTAYLPYNAGKLINYKGTAIVSEMFNFYDHSTGKAKLLGGCEYQICGTYTSVSYADLNGNAETLSIATGGIFTPTNTGFLTVTGGNSTDTCVHLTHSGYRNYGTDGYQFEQHNPFTRLLPVSTYFPEGMNGWGDTYDSLAANQADKRIGSVDMGTLNWQAYSSDTTGHSFVVAIPSDCASVIDNRYEGNIRCAKYETVKFLSSQEFTSNDKVIGQAYAPQSILVRDTAYSDAAVFKTAMSGVYLDYELATPVVTPISPALSLSYKVDDFGTEESLPSNFDAVVPVTTPFKGNVIYNEDYVRTIENLDKNYQSMDSMDALLTLMGQLHNGTITRTWNATTKRYDFAFTPNA